MVCSIKQILQKCLGIACVTYHEMLTLLCEGDSVINEIPLTYVFNYPYEMTSAHFIQDIRGAKSHDLDTINSKHLLKRTRYLQNVRDNLRKRFQKLYLGERVCIPKSRYKRKEISFEEIVFIGSNNAKRLNWPLGCDIELYPGKDGIERVAKLRVANGFVIRPLQRLYPLEMSLFDLPSDIVLGENFPESNKDSDRLKSPEILVPSHVAKDLRPMK
ncbi:integrase catalytic domain-containing protein [Trichonephila clavipes]|nr:integrase catalytic domain-containing protein [Trichonephila clavipes]